MPRHARLFELIRQQNRAADLAERLGAAPLDDATLRAIAQRAAASWSKLC
ncbi:MAG: hypothetical protein WAO78_06730 [Roseovarius sp.]